MSGAEPNSFHLRLPPELKDRLNAATAKNGTSLNAEIVRRIETTFVPDAALRFAEIIRPHLAALDEDDCARVAALAVEALEIFAGKSAPKRTDRS